MLYFIFRAALAFAFSLILTILLVFLSHRYRKENCRNPLQVFYPSLCALTLIAFSLYSTTPKLLDSLAVMRNAYSFKQVTVASRQALPGVLKTEDGGVYNYNPFSLQIELGKSYNISYTPWQKFIINIAAVETNKTE